MFATLQLFVRSGINERPSFATELLITLLVALQIAFSGLIWLFHILKNLYYRSKDKPEGSNDVNCKAHHSESNHHYHYFCCGHCNVSSPVLHGMVAE